MRLMQKGRDIGLLNKDVYGKFLKKKKRFEIEIDRLKRTRIKPERINNVLKALGTPAISEDITLEQLLKRPEVNYDVVRHYAPPDNELDEEVERQLEIQVKYAGYISRQIETAEKLKKLEGKKIPEHLDYRSLPGISKEILAKLEEVRPVNLGQAGRIQGMTPAALSLIMIKMEKMKTRSKSS
jgi:tRNA uridine 5-carboxymethylaminomethyl modification enzyme